MSKFISFIKVPGGNRKLELAVPSNGKGTVNLLCGENCSGKSYILQHLEMIYRTAKETDGKLGFELSYCMDSGKLDEKRALYYGKIWKLKDKCASFHFATQKNKGADPTDGPVGLFENTLRFVYELIFSKNESNISEEIFSDINNVNLRLELIDKINVAKEGEICYPCDKNHPLVQQIEAVISNRRLYYRFYHEKKGQICIEFVFVKPDGHVITQSKWSDGQKSVFYLLINLYFQNSSVVILDEIENHMHPSYISKILNIIKQSGRQCIVSTHHPHVIFSEYVDQVYYIELEKTEFPSDEREPIEYKPSTKAFPRKITNLLSDYNKISNVYKLFDQRDAQLLNLSKFFQLEGELAFYKMLESLPTANTPVPSKNTTLPDKQTDMFYDLTKHSSHSEKIRILDVGAGLGRIKEELDKRYILSDTFIWYLLNPDKEQHENVKTLFQEDENVFPVTKYDEIPNSLFDIVIVANVIHEITPLAFANIISEAQNKLKPEGEMIILDMEPLLHAEQYAVPYNPAELVTLFNELGWVATSNLLPHKFVTLYRIRVKKANSKELTEQTINKKIERLWKKKYRDALAGYNVMQDKKLSGGEYQKKLQDMVTVISIGSYFEKIWE